MQSIFAVWFIRLNSKKKMGAQNLGLESELNIMSLCASVFHCGSQYCQNKNPIFNTYRSNRAKICRLTAIIKKCLILALAIYIGWSVIFLLYFSRALCLSCYPALLSTIFICPQMNTCFLKRKLQLLRVRGSVWETIIS